MTRWIVPMVALLGGCIIYDTDGKCPGCDPDPYGDNGGGGGNGDSGDPADSAADSGSDPSDSGDSGSDPSDSGDSGAGDSGDSGSGDSGSGSVEMKISLDPDTAVAGTTFIGHLSSDDESFDWGRVSSVTFYGGVAVLAFDPDHGELDLAIQVPQDAAPGSADLLVETIDGDAFFQYDALTILPAE